MKSGDKNTLSGSNGSGGNGRAQDDPPSKPADAPDAAGKRKSSRAIGTVISLSERLSLLHKTNPWRTFETIRDASTDIATPQQADMAVTPETPQPEQAASNQQDKSGIEQAITSETLAAKPEATSTIALKSESKLSIEAKTRGEAPTEKNLPERKSSVPASKGNGKDQAPLNGSGGGGRGSPPLEQRSGDKDFREVLRKGLAACRRNLITVAIFSIATNLLVLAIPIYLFNVSDRVLTSRSVDTLMMLTMVVAGAIGGHVLLDMMRRFILMRIAVEAESKLGAPVLSAAAKSAQGGSSRDFQVLADLQQLRGFITGPVILTMFDAPVSPVYLLVVFLIHPQLGFIVATAGCCLFAVALINQRVTAVSLWARQRICDARQSAG